jgi:radical copper oxidase GlxA-like protein/galactose oxidase-like protein
VNSIGPRCRLRTKLTKWVGLLAAAGALAALNLPTLTTAASSALHSYKINSASYKKVNGHWSILPVPNRFKVNAIHAALLYTGKVLIIAGSGNDQGNFDAGRFKSLLWDPATDRFQEIPTPSDMFCGGHAYLPDGRLLIAGGTKRYEVLADKVKRAAGVMTVKNESPNGGAIRLAKGTEFVSPEGVLYRATQATTIKPAAKHITRAGAAVVTPSHKEIWVEAVQTGHSSVNDQPTQYAIKGIAAKQQRNVYGFATALNMKKQEYWGDNKSYLFDPATERYERVSNLTLARWYPTLVGLKGGRVLAVSGLDQFGRMIPGQNEIYDPASRHWTNAPNLKRTFPTYPALFLMPNGNLFYTGSNAGYGSDKVGRDPGIWNLGDNSFRKVPGLRDPTQTETSGSVLLPPAQNQRYMIAGGGGVGDSDKSTARTDIIDLKRRNPGFRPGPDLSQPTRYPNLVITPDDKVVITGGSRGYRGEHASDILECHVYDPKSGSLSRLADPAVGRNYHSEALLLPDGRIITLGSDPLYSNAADTLPGNFEKRIEIYSPPYLYRGDRPRIIGGTREIARGQTANFGSPDSAVLASARLLRPSAVTHVTDVEQRSIALDMTSTDSGFRVTIPRSAGLVPSGWYMLFVTNRDKVPSAAHWVHVR